MPEAPDEVDTHLVIRVAQHMLETLREEYLMRGVVHYVDELVGEHGDLAQGALQFRLEILDRHGWVGAQGAHVLAQPMDGGILLAGSTHGATKSSMRRAKASGRCNCGVWPASGIRCTRPCQKYVGARPSKYAVAISGSCAP